MVKSNQQYICDVEVKDVFKKYSHRKCTCEKARVYCTKVTGSFLNNYLMKYRSSATDPHRFPPKKKYNICSNLNISITRYMKAKDCDSTPTLVSNGTVSKKLPVKETSNVVKDHNHINVIAHTIEKTRSQRLFFRSRIPANDEKLKGIKNVRVKFEDETHDIDIRAKRLDKKSKFTKDVLDNYSRVPFGSLKMRFRRERMADVAKVVLGGCVERQAFKKDCDEYMHHNRRLAIEIVNLLDGVRDYLESKLRMNFDDVKDVAMAPVEDDEEGLIEELDKEKKSHKLAISLLGELSGNGYERVRKTMDDLMDLPSYKMLKKKRPSISSLEFVKLNSFDSCEEVGGNGDGRDDNTVFLDMEEMNRVPDEYELELLLRRLAAQERLDGAKIDGDYSTYIQLLENKHVNEGRTIDGNVAVLDSFDGAEHIRSKKAITSVVSFSSSLLCTSWINSRSVTAGSSLNILTWQQMKGAESIYTLTPAVESYYQSKKVLCQQSRSRNNYSYYDLHDGKMLYLLTQHSQWSRKNNPFLLCKCNRGEGVVNNNSDLCTKILHGEQVQLYERSRRRWDHKRNRGPWTVKEHMDWVDEMNHGVSHFGIHPDLLPRESLRFDTFHMKCAITRKLMGYVRKFFLNQSDEVRSNFIDVLKSFWRDYHLYVWRNKKNFSSFQGNELALFVANTHTIIEYMENVLDPTEEVIHMIESLQLWVKLFKFLGHTYIEDAQVYKKTLIHFELNLKFFYKAGASTFLSKSGIQKDGNEETFYSHALRFYMIDIAILTFEKHKVGVGIFNMQGFERRNKESKNTMRRFCNNRGNTLPNNLGKLWEVFQYNVNAV